MGSYQEKEAIPLKRVESTLFKWIMREKEPDYLKHDSDPEKNKRKNAIKKFSRLLD